MLDHERRPAGADREDLLAKARVIRQEAEILNLPGIAGVAALREGEVLLATGDARGALGVLEESVRELDGAGATDLLAVDRAVEGPCRTDDARGVAARRRARAFCIETPPTGLRSRSRRSERHCRSRSRHDRRPFRVRLEDEADADEVAALLEHRLGRLAAVEEVQAEVAQPQAIGEVVIVVAGAVAITRGGRDVVTYVRQTVEELRGLVEGWRDLKRTLFVELDGAHVDVRDVGDDELERLAADST